MCGILAIFDLAGRAPELTDLALRLSNKLRHRGPDRDGIFVASGAILAHQRLSIIDLQGGAQPLSNLAGDCLLTVNGEIYNHLALRAQFGASYAWQTQSDCEVILALYARRGCAFLNELNGIFAFALYDARSERYLIARDPIGVVPLYMGRDSHGALYVASEVKALVGTCCSIQEFPPGCYLSSDVGRVERYYRPRWREFEQVQGAAAEPANIRDALEKAVKRQLMSDAPWGALLSGGLDSSLVCALAAKQLEVEAAAAGKPPTPLCTFSIGFAGAPDLLAAAHVSQAISSQHHEVVYTLEEGIEALSEVIYHIESFDVTTVRASTPMYLLGKRIAALGVKMVLSGEGADEVFGGYLYFHRAPNARAFHEETVRKLDQLHQFDCLRANKSLAASGVEVRVPFLDREFLDVAMAIDPTAKMCLLGKPEKWILRSAFAGALPEQILWRQKEQFSDGVGYAWIDGLKAMAEQRVSDLEMSYASTRFAHNPPLTKEAYLYRSIFERHFPQADVIRCVPEGKSVACSTPAALEWDAQFAQLVDPSGRSVKGVHKSAYC